MTDAGCACQPANERRAMELVGLAARPATPQVVSQTPRHEHGATWSGLEGRLASCVARAPRPCPAAPASLAFVECPA